MAHLTVLLEALDQLLRRRRRCARAAGRGGATEGGLLRNQARRFLWSIVFDFAGIGFQDASVAKGLGIARIMEHYPDRLFTLVRPAIHCCTPPTNHSFARWTFYITVIFFEKQLAESYLLWQ